MSIKIKTIFIILLMAGLFFYFKGNENSPLQEGYNYYQKGEYKEALDYFTRHAENDSQAAFSLSVMYWEGIAVPEDRLIARKWLIKSANLENRDALYNLGYLRYHELIESTPEDIHGFSSLSKAVDLGSSEAKIFLNEIESSQSGKLESRLLPIYGEQTWFEKRATLRELEKLAEGGNKEAIYQYLNNANSSKRSIKTEGYLHPFIESKDPKFMYLKYTLITQDVRLLIDSANANYPDAVYFLYQVYNGDKEVKNLKSDTRSAEVYLQLSADLDHHDGLIKKIESLLIGYSERTQSSIESPEKYVIKLLEKYPNSYQATITAAKVYSHVESEFYNPQKAFELMLKAYDIQPSAEVKFYLAEKYAYGIGVKKDLKKAVDLLKETITNDQFLKESRYLIISLYFHFDISEYIEKENIIEMLKDSVNRDNTYDIDYRLAHYYADILLEQDAFNNDEYAFSLYEQGRGNGCSSYVFQLVAMTKYKKIMNEDILTNLVKGLQCDSTYSKISSSKRREVYDILFKYGINYPEVSDFFIERSLFDDSIKLIMGSLLSENKEIHFKYIIKNIEHESYSENIDEAKLIEYYQEIIKLADSGYVDAMNFIVTRIYHGELMQDGIFYDYNFDRLTNITKEERSFWRNKCADLGNNICLKDLSLIYKYGKDGVEKDSEKAKEYESHITVPLNSTDLELYSIEKSNFEYVQQKYNSLIHEDKSQENLLLLAKYYSSEDIDKSFIYAEGSYNLGNKKASQYLYNYYVENICKNKDNINKAANYFKEWIETEKPHSNEFTYNSARIIGNYYLEAPCLVEKNLDKAIEWYQLSLDYPFGIDSHIYTELNKIYSNGMESVNQNPAVNMHISALKNNNDYMTDMHTRLGKMSFAEPSFSKLYEAFLFKGDVKNAYYYGLLLNVDVNNIAMFYSLSENERKNIETRVAEYLNQNKQ